MNLVSKVLIAVLLVCWSACAEAQLTTFGEFQISGGRYQLPGDDKGYVVLAGGTFGLQFSILAINLGAGPSLKMKDNDRSGLPLWDKVGLDMSIGAMLRIPLYKKHLLVAGCDATFYGLSPHAGILFRSRWNYKGVFARVGLGSGSYSPGFYGIGVKMTLNH